MTSKDATEHPTPWMEHPGDDDAIVDARGRYVCDVGPPSLVPFIIEAVNAYTPPAAELPARETGQGEAGEPTGDDLLEIWDSAQHRYVAQREPHDCPIEEFARRALFQAGQAHAAEQAHVCTPAGLHELEERVSELEGELQIARKGLGVAVERKAAAESRATVAEETISDAIGWAIQIIDWDPGSEIARELPALLDAVELDLNAEHERAVAAESRATVAEGELTKQTSLYAAQYAILSIGNDDALARIADLERQVEGMRAVVEAANIMRKAWANDMYRAFILPELAVLNAVDRLRSASSPPEGE
jgi:outer membrane murein-binding lipoprotein Lpp